MSANEQVGGVIVPGGIELQQLRTSIAGHRARQDGPQVRGGIRGLNLSADAGKMPARPGTPVVRRREGGSEGSEGAGCSGRVLPPAHRAADPACLFTPVLRAQGNPSCFAPCCAPLMQLVLVMGNLAGLLAGAAPTASRCRGAHAKHVRCQRDDM